MGFVIFWGSIGFGCLNTASRGRWQDIQDVRRSYFEACPECGAVGAIEFYSKHSSERTSFNTTTFYTTPMVNCTNACSYRCELNLHISRTEASNSRAVTTAMDGPSLGSDTSNITKEKVPLVVSAEEEDRRRMELREKKNNKAGSCGLHPEWASLGAQFGSCPGCGGPVRFTRWEDVVGGGIFPSHVLERVDMAECDGGGCGYIARLDEHKSRV